MRTALLAVVAVVGAACSSDPCSRQSPCPNDPMKTQTDIQNCRATLDANKNATCYKEVVTWADCVTKSVVCTSGGTTDVQLSSTKASNDCRNQFDAASTCCASNQSSSACQ